MAAAPLGRREAIRQLAELRRRPAEAEDAQAALAAMKQAEGDYDAADARFAEAERALDEAREERAQARWERYAARQEHERASTTADRLARRERELSERLDGMAELREHGAPSADPVGSTWPTGHRFKLPRPGCCTRNIRGLSR